MAYGVVRISIDRGALRLRWRVSRSDPKRYSLNPGLKDDRPSGGRQYAQALKLASWIEVDIERGEFDPTLLRYSERRRAKAENFGQVFEGFLDYKRKFAESKRTLEKYNALRGHLLRLNVAQLRGDAITVERAIAFARQLRETPLAAKTVNEHLTNLGTAWEWGIEEGLLNPHGGKNPWRRAKKQVKGSKVRETVFFSEEEVGQILTTIREHPHFKIYFPLAVFLLATGARIGEARGLCWENILPDGRVQITSTLSRDAVRRQTKNRKTRCFKVPPLAHGILMEMKRSRGNVSDNDAVFLGKQGGAIGDQTWRKAWKEILRLAGVRYRRPHGTRSTVITKALMGGESPAVVATVVGNSPKVIYEHYAAQVQGDFLKDPDCLTDGSLDERSPETTPEDSNAETVLVF